MSLKHFHILFIAVSVMLTFGFAVWALLAQDQSTMVRALGVSSGLLGIGLLIYGVWFYKKSKHVII